MKYLTCISLSLLYLTNNTGAVRLRGDDGGLSLEELNEAESEAVMEATTELSDISLESENKEASTAKSAQKVEDQKFAEVVNLMGKYDRAEAKYKWLNSAEYALEQEQKEKAANEIKYKSDNKKEEINPAVLA